MKKTSIILFFTFSFYFAHASSADSISTDTLTDAEISAYPDSVQSTFDFKTGMQTIGANLATINVPDSFVFLAGKDAQRLLTEIWSNPEDPSILGMLIPQNTSVLSENCWGIVYSYEEDGHVKDDDAESINYDDLLKEMQESILSGNSERMKAGYQKIELTGWAQKPYYDKAAHKLHWAKELRFGEDSLHTLNYNIRVLGREGVLVMNAVAGMNQFPDVQQNIAKILASTELNPGNQYGDYNASVDKLAEYGVGGLIAGAVLTKTGIIAKIGLVLLKAWKVIAIGAIALAGVIKKWFSGRKKTEF